MMKYVFYTVKSRKEYKV